MSPGIAKSLDDVADHRRHRAGVEDDLRPHGDDRAVGEIETVVEVGRVGDDGRAGDRFSVIACSSVMACSLWRITSKVIGSMAAVWIGSVAVGVMRCLRQIDGEIAGQIDDRGLPRADIDRGLGMLDHGRPANSMADGSSSHCQTRGHRPLEQAGS